MAYLTVTEFKEELADTQYIQGTLVTDAQITSAIDRASDEADGYLRTAGYDLPLVSYGDDFRGRVLDISIYWLASSTTILNTDDVTKNIAYINYKAALKWFHSLVRGEISPDIIDSDTDNDDERDVTIYLSGKDRRGW